MALSLRFCLLIRIGVLAAEAAGGVDGLRGAWSFRPAVFQEVQGF